MKLGAKYGLFGWKVEDRKVAEVFFGGGIIGFGCLLLVIEAAKIYPFSIDD